MWILVDMSIALVSGQKLREKSNPVVGHHVVDTIGFRSLRAAFFVDIDEEVFEAGAQVELVDQISRDGQTPLRGWWDKVGTLWFRWCGLHLVISRIHAFESFEYNGVPVNEDGFHIRDVRLSVDCRDTFYAGEALVGGLPEPSE